MLIKTHLSVTFFLVLFLWNYIPSNKFVFLFVALLATYVPDIDSKNSTLGKRKINRVLQFFVRHRGVFHSFTFMFVIALGLYWFFPIVALPFCFGYASHLVADCLTKAGIRPFYPLNFGIKGFARTGKTFEIILYLFSIIGSIYLILVNIF